MTQIGDKDTKQEPAVREQVHGGEASARGHTGEGAASVMAQLILQGENQGHEDDQPGERPA